MAKYSNQKATLQSVLSEETLELVEQTSRLSNWLGTELTAEQSKVREAFSHLVAYHPSSYFDMFATHPFWKNWRSKSSSDQKGCVLYTCSHALDCSWLEKLLPVCSEEPTIEQMLKSAVSNKSPTMLPFIIGLDRQKENIFDKIPKLSLQIAQRSPKQALLNLLDMNVFPQRVFEMECLVVSRNNKKNKYCRQEVLEKMWAIWGEPTSPQYSQLFRLAMARTHAVSDLRFENFLLSCYNPSSSSWYEEDDVSLLTGWVPRRLAVLEEKLAQGWLLSEKAWDRFLMSAPKLSDEQMSACMKLRLNVELDKNKGKAPASLRKKI